MANRNDETGREESTYGRHEQNRPWRESQNQGQGQQYGRGQGMQQQGLGQRSTGGQGFGEFGERSRGWESERGSDFYGGQGLGPREQGFGQAGGQGSEHYGRYGQVGQGYGQGSERYETYGQGGERFGQGGQTYGPGIERYGQGGQGYGSQQQEWQRVTQPGWQGEQFGTQYGNQGYGMGNRLLQGRQGLGEGGIPGGYGGMSGGYGGQQLGYGSGLGPGSGLGQRNFRGIGPKNYTRSDERIREDVCERLTQDDDLDASEIEVKAEQGVVTLEGTVDERWMKHRAEDLAENCSGVREVENRIRVESAVGKARSGTEALNRSGSQGEARTKPGSSGSTPH